MSIDQTTQKNKETTSLPLHLPYSFIPKLINTNIAIISNNSIAKKPMHVDQTCLLHALALTY